MSFAKLMLEDRRLVVLRLLSEAPGYSANESILHAALEDWGHQASRDQVRGDLLYLEEQGCLATEDESGILVVTANQRGLDAAAGRARVPGVKRPAPKG